MDYDHSILTFNQPRNSVSFTSSTTSIVDFMSKTTSLMTTRTRSLSKRYYQQKPSMEHRISSHSITKKQEARPLGTCVRKCGQCRQLKHILLAECTVCLRMMDVDLKDCKCQIFTSRNVIEHFICSICNNELTLDGYIICANRTCQTILSALIDKDITSETQEKSRLSTTLTNISYPKSAHRTVAVQVNTLINLSPLQRFLSTIIDNENEESSSLWSKHNFNEIIVTSSDSSDSSQLSMDSSADASVTDIARNMTTGFNSNQPTKLALESEDELQQIQQQSQIHNLTYPSDTTVNNNPEFIPIPKTPRCLAIMNVRKRRDRLSTVLTLQTNQTCQTQLSCLIDSNKMIKGEELSNTTIIRTNNPNKIERQTQVDTIKGRFDDLCQVQIDIVDHIEKDSKISMTNDERILQALTDRDGQRWSELIDQLINEQSNFSPSDKAQQLLDAVERLHTSRRLNNLTTGQLQRKIRYAMSQLKHIDEHSYLKNNLKTTKNNRLGKNTECNGRMDMAVTVRQIDKSHHRHQSTVSSDQNWKPYVDRLFEQGHSANEIQRLLHEAAETTMQSDDQRLQDVFHYINIKANQPRAKTAPPRTVSMATVEKTEPVTPYQFQSTNLFQSNRPKETTSHSGGIMTRPLSSISERKVMSNEPSPAFNDKDQDSTTKLIKHKSSLPSNSLIKSPTIKSDIIEIEPSKKKSIIDLNEDIYKNPSINSTEITTPRERSNDKKFDGNNVVVTRERTTKQIQDVVESKTSQAGEISSPHHRKSFSSIGITPSNQSNDTPVINLEEQCIHALSSVQNTLEVIENADVRLHPHPSNIQSEVNKLIQAFQSYLRKSDTIDRDNIELLMTQCIEQLNNEKKAIVPELKERHFQNLNENISHTLSLLQEYKKMAMPIQTNNDNSPFNRHISNVMMVSPDTSVPLKRVEENIEQTIQSQSPPNQLSSNTTLDLKQQNTTSEYQETASLIRCRPIPYTSSNEQRSTETLKQVLICSTEYISLKSKDLNEQSIASESDLHYVPDIPSKTESDSHNDQPQTKWLDSLLSKMSDNISKRSDIFSASPSLSVIDPTKIDRNDKQDKKEQKMQEFIPVDTEDKQAPSMNNPSKSSIPIRQHTTNVPGVMSDSQNPVYETYVIRLEEEHAISILAPDQDVSMLDEQLQVVQTKISQKELTISSKPIQNSEGQITPLQEEKNNDNIPEESSNLDDDSTDTSQKSPSVTALHKNNVDQEKQSTSSDINDQPQPMITQSSSHSNVDLSEQLDQSQIPEDNTSPEQLVASSASTSEESFDSPQQPFDMESPILIPEHTKLPNSHTNTGSETSIESLSLNNQEEEKRTTSELSFPSDENKDQNSMKTSEPSRHIDKTPKSSQAHTQVLDGNTSIANSKLVNHQNDINKLQLPISTQNLSISNSILTHLNEQDDTIPSQKSVSSDNPILDEHERASVDSKDQNNDNKKSSSGKIDHTVNNEFYTPLMLLPNHSIAQQPANTVLSPSRTTENEKSKYQQLTALSSVPLAPISSPITNIPEEDERTVKQNNAPGLFIEEPSGSATPLVEPTTTDDHKYDGRSNKSRSNVQKSSIDSSSEEELRNKLTRGNDQLQTKHDSPAPSNASTQESSWLDETTHASPLRSTELLITSKTDDQQPKTQLTINRRFSRPKILVEDIQTPLILTPHASILSVTSDDDIPMKSKQQLENEPHLMPEDIESSNVSSTTTLHEENQSNKMPIQSIIKEKSSSKERTSHMEVANTVVSKDSTARDDKLDENHSDHSSVQSEQSDHDEDNQSKKKNSLRLESLIKLLPSPPDQQSLDDNHSEPKVALDQTRPPYRAEYDDKNKDRLDDQQPSYIEQHLSPMISNSDTRPIESSSSVIIKRRPVSSTVTAILPSSIMTVNTQRQKLKSQIPSPERKYGKFTSDKPLAVTSVEAQEPISVSSFNLPYLTDLTSINRQENEDKKLPDDNPHHINSKQQSSSTNSLIRGNIPSLPIPKLLLKRSLIKQPSTVAQSIKPNLTLSITDISTSSNNTVATDHLLSTHSTISNQEEIVSLKKPNKRNTSKNRLITNINPVSKRSMLRNTSRPSQNQTFISSNRHVEASTKKFMNKSLLTNSELAYDTEPGSESWLKSHEGTNQILIIDEQDEKKPSVHPRQQKKQTKKTIINGSRLTPLNLKAHSDHQAYTIDSSRLPNIDQSCGEQHMKKLPDENFRRSIIRLPVTQIEKFECGIIGPHLHPSSIAHQLFPLPSIHDHPYLPPQLNQITESFTDRFYSLMSSENNDDKQAFESILNWQHHIPKIEQNKLKYRYLLETSTGNSVRGKQYPILTDEIDMIDDPNACTIVNKWAFADLVNTEREKFIQERGDNIFESKNRLKPIKNIKICFRKRPLTEFEENVFKEVDIISIIDSQTMLLHIPSITVDNQVFIKNRKFKCDQTFDVHCQTNTIYHSTLAPLLNMAIEGSKCLCLIGGGKYSGKTSLLRSFLDLFAFDLTHFLSTYDIYVKFLGICHNRIVNILQNYSPIRLMKSIIPNEEFHIENERDIDYIICQIKKRRRFIHQLIEINFRENNSSKTIGSLMIVVLASSQYIYTRNLCSHRRKFLINSLNKTILSFKRALLGIRQNPDRIRTAFNNDILTRLIQPYVFHDRSNICYIGTFNPGHRHRIATKSTFEFARNLRFCLKCIHKKRRQRKKSS